MAEETEGVSVKKLVVLVTLIIVLICLLLPHFNAKPKAKYRKGSVSAQAGLTPDGQPLPPNFEKLPPEIQKMILEGLRRAKK